MTPRSVKSVKRKPVAYGALAVDSDWGGKMCLAIGPLSQPCKIYVKHTGEAHQFCRKPGHDKGCTPKCFEVEDVTDY